MFLNEEYLEKNKEKRYLLRKGKKEEEEEGSYKDEYENIYSKNEIIIFGEGNEIFEFIISREQYKNIFVNEINKIIQIMKDIVYTPPYPILFGRISLTELKPKEKINRNQKEINELFYEGLNLEEFKYDKRS